MANFGETAERMLPDSMKRGGLADRVSHPRNLFALLAVSVVVNFLFGLEHAEIITFHPENLPELSAVVHSLEYVVQTATLLVTLVAAVRSIIRRSK